MNPATPPVIPRFRKSLWVAIICLIFACVFADVAHFLVGWPGEYLVWVPALLLLPIGVIALAVSVLTDRRLWQSFLRQAHSLTLIALCVTLLGLIWLNVRSKVITEQRFRREDPIIITTSCGWPFPLHEKADITKFYVEFGHRQPESEYPLPQRDFREEKFMPWEYWLMNLIHWFLILFVIFLVCQAILRRASKQDVR
jgi:hypothetical protein